MERTETLKLGVVSDTHGLFDPKLKTLFAGCDRIFHAGDICGQTVLDELAKLAPVEAIRGNCDAGYETNRLPDWILRTVRGWRILVVHDVGHPERPHGQIRELIQKTKPHLVISGHSHRARISTGENGPPVFLNPGSSGRKRFKLLRTAALIRMEPGALSIRLYSLEETAAQQPACIEEQTVAADLFFPTHRDKSEPVRP